MKRNSDAIPPSSRYQPSQPLTDPKRSEGRLLGLLVASFYALFTLLPDSSSMMVSWPWVFLWQVGLAASVLWWLWRLWHQRQLQGLGNGLDWVVGFAVIGLIVSASLAEFPAQARWYSWAVLGFFAALYALSEGLHAPAQRYRLLIGQGYLNIAFIIVSLSLWVSQTLLPEVTRLQQLRQYGVNLPFNFSVLELRNWAPIGHQNYVAGYLVLTLPLLVGLSVLQTGWRRWIWVLGVVLGLVDLYTTSSKGGWLGLVVMVIVAFVLLVRQPVNRRWLGLGGAVALVVLTLVVFFNNRFRTVIAAAFSGQAGGELAYRMITAATGWRMGSSHLWSGVGAGGVPLLYQQYRPGWAGREAELAYQLHNTPVQLWAEFGVWGIGTLLAAIALLAYLGLKWWRVTAADSVTVPRTDQILTWSIGGGLLAYGVNSCSDYQLDNVCISGTLVIFLSFLVSEFRQVFAMSQATGLPVGISDRRSRWLAGAGLGLFLVVGIWLVPAHWAWQLSSQGFAALSRQDVNTFVQRLSRATGLAPWEPYYPYQLGWNLGNLSLQTSDPQQQQLRSDGISWLSKGVEVSPYQEFGHTNLAWLLLDRDPKAAAQGFARSAQLVPAKRGVFYGLGLSQLAQGKVDVAVEALTLEALRDPMLIASPVWKSPQFQPVYAQLTSQLEAKYTGLLEKYSHPGYINSYLHQCRGGLSWWLGNLEAARADWESYGNGLSKLVLSVSEGKNVAELQQLPPAIAAWLNPSARLELLQQAWITAPRTAAPSPQLMQPAPPQLMQQLLTGMASSRTFDEWVKQKAPIQQYRRQRAGFGVLSRHIDGPIPQDFLTVVDNVVMTNFFDQLLPSLFYASELDLALQPWRDALLQRLVK